MTAWLISEISGDSVNLNYVERFVVTQHWETIPRQWSVDVVMVSGSKVRLALFPSEQEALNRIVAIIEGIAQ